MKTVFFFPNGNSGVYDGEERMDTLQRPWFLLFAEFIESRGYDPTDFEYHLPDGRHIATVFKIPEGYNWRIK